MWCILSCFVIIAVILPVICQTSWFRYDKLCNAWFYTAYILYIWAINKCNNEIFIYFTCHSLNIFILWLIISFFMLTCKYLHDPKVYWPISYLCRWLALIFVFLFILVERVILVIVCMLWKHLIKVEQKREIDPSSFENEGEYDDSLILVWAILLRSRETH